MLAKTREQMTNLHEDTTYILGDLIMEGSLDGGDHPVVIDGQFTGDITAPEVIIREQGKVTGAVKAKTVVKAQTQRTKAVAVAVAHWR